METEFLNFHDEENFRTDIYQNELLDDSQSSLLDIVGDGYHRHDSDEYGDHSIIWEQDVERELNGDLAVIPMSGQINSFPKLSNSPPSKDFQKIFSDWQHLTSIEAHPTEDLTVDLQLHGPGLVVDMLDCFQPPKIITPQNDPSTSKIVSSFDFSTTEIPKTPEKKNKEIVRKTGGKNLALLKQVINEETFKTELNSSDELDALNDNFDITTYVNGDDDILNHIKPEKKMYRKFGGCYEKNMAFDVKSEDIQEKKIEKQPEKEEIIKEEKKIEDEEECVDVETVTEQIPVLEARDLNSLLEQFEATEAVNPTLPQNLFEDKQMTTSQKQIPNDNKQKVKQLNSELKQPTTKVKNTVSVELLQKIKASSSRKQVNVIPARPSKKIRTTKMIEFPKKVKIPPSDFQLDHDYCSPVKNEPIMKKFNSPDRKKCDNKSIDDKNLGNIIDDTAIRIGKQIKNAINNENILKHKQSLLKNQPIKNADGKVMISLLKTNNRQSLLSKINGNTIINTINTNDEEIQNIIVNASVERNAKKRKLNLEEYKKLRGEIIKTSCENSPGNSGSNSPLPQSNKVEYQELIMKMASEILKTNAKQKQGTSETKLEKFIPPEEKKIEERKVEEKPKINDNYEMKTIVSIGVNTEESYLKTLKNENKIAFKLVKKEKLQRNKYFDSKSSESEENTPKKEVASKINNIINPIIQNCNKINRNSLITNITATLLQQSPQINTPEIKLEPEEHGEDKTVIILNKNEVKPEVKTIAIQTEPDIEKVRNYRKRRDSSTSSTASTSSKNVRKSNKSRSIRNSSSNSISSSLGSRWSRSRSRSSSHSEYSSYSSNYSRSKSRSISPRRWRSDRSRSNNRYSRSRRRSRSNYRNDIRLSYSRSRSRRRHERETAERERMREVEERRVIYVGKISDDTTRADLRRRFQSFGPITNVSVHFRDHGDNYGFVTFAYKTDAYEAVERGNDEPHIPKYDISFGGRRAFCKTRYSDLDNIEDDAMNPQPIFRRNEDSFDILLRELQAKLCKRKV